MTPLSSVRCFQVAELDALRSAKNLELRRLDGIWASITNDQFYALTQYVLAFTDTKLKGYRQTEEPDAFEACAITLQALEDVVTTMNQSPSLTAIASVMTTRPVPRDITREEVEAAWSSLGITAEPRMKSLLAVVRRQFVAWTTGYLSGDVGDISALVKFGPKPIGRDLELVFSGGGIRAAAFALGVLMYVSDVGRVEQIRQISSVSGGSITNGFVANLLTKTHAITDESISGFARRLASDGIPLEKAGRSLVTLFWITLSPLILSSVLVLLVALGASKALLMWALVSFVLFICLAFHTYRTFSGLTGVIVGGWFGAILNDSRVEPWKWTLSDLVSLTRMRSALLNAEGLNLRALRDIDSPITHVFTATDLRNGEHFHFSQQWATSNTYGPSDPGEVRVDEAVRASAAFPGALPPVKISIGRLRLPPQLTVGMRDLQLVDGGVRDNLGHVFQSQLLGDSDAQRMTLTRYGSTHQWIVADASAPRGVADLSESLFARVPGLRHIGQLVTFPRVLSIMNQSNSEARSLALSTRFGGTAGFVVGIRDSPVEFCRRGINDEVIAHQLLRGGGGSGRSDDDPRKLRAEAALRALVRDESAAESHWNGECYQNYTIPTTLDGIGAFRVASLIHHGYVLTMCHAHVEFDWPLAPDHRWSADRFADLLRERPSHP